MDIIESDQGITAITLSETNVQTLAALFDPARQVDVADRYIYRNVGAKGLLVVRVEPDDVHYDSRPEGGPGPARQILDEDHAGS
jgi:hypothetical protein